MDRDELNEQIMVVPFVEMEPHVARGAVIIVDPGFDLAEVGALLARDDKAGVQRLLAENRIGKASTVDLETWRREKRFFRILIVQPFVLAQNFTALAPQDN